VKWRAFRYGQDTHDLGHLHPRTITYFQEAKGDKPARTYAVEVHFSMHCFTRGFKPGEAPDPDLCYSDHRETRVFDFQRYSLSKQLPATVDDLSKRKCYHTGRGNFFTIELVNHLTGCRVDYEIYFTAVRSARAGVVDLYVQSAYVRDPQHGNNRPQRKAISFHVILFNVLNNMKIRVPK
jgi:hypothetical protein